jgi:hypothetical protein
VWENASPAGIDWRLWRSASLDLNFIWFFLPALSSIPAASQSGSSHLFVSRSALRRFSLSVHFLPDKISPSFP